MSILTALKRKGARGKTIEEAINDLDYPPTNTTPECIGERLYLIDYDYYYRYDALQYISKLPACTIVRIGNKIGRNFDWYYDEKPTIAIRTKYRRGKFKTLGVANGIGSLTNDILMDCDAKPEYKVLPYFTNDCLNEYGVFAGINIVPADYGFTTGTFPEGNRLCSMMIPRFVTDNAKTAAEAIELLEVTDIFSSKAIGYEIHAMIADANDTYVVEFKNNQMIVLKNTDIPNYDSTTKTAIMTNFYLSDWDGDVKAVFLNDTKAEVEATGLQPHAMGLERYSICLNGNDVNDILEDCAYTNMYDEDVDWLSEFVDGDLDIYSEASEYAEIKSLAEETFANRKRDGKTWYTAHSSVYDISNKTLELNVGENFDTAYKFEMSSYIME